MTEIETVNDLEIKDLDGFKLSAEELDALNCFRRVRLRKLLKTEEETSFHEQFEYFRTVSMITPYKDFAAQYCGTNI